MWPVVLYGEEITLRPVRFRDRTKWNNVRAENKEWLLPWEATLPRVPADSPASEFISKRPSFFEMVRALNREARSGRSYSFLIWHGENLIGQITRRAGLAKNRLGQVVKLLFRKCRHGVVLLCVGL